MVASVAGTLEGGRITAHAVPRAASSASMALPAARELRTGEVSLAHLGVLVLDELPEFQRAVLDSCAAAQNRRVDVARANAMSASGAGQLVAAMNPCRCGHSRRFARGGGSRVVP